jgi:DNA-binding response OmpR family regulator
MIEKSDSVTRPERICVLVVEQEASICELLKLSLEENGFRVVLAGSGMEATQLFASIQGEVDVVLLDWGMDRMSGSQTLDWLRQAKPGLPCCVMTGGGTSVEASNIAVLRKPFALDVVVHTLRMLCKGSEEGKESDPFTPGGG